MKSFSLTQYAIIFGIAAVVTYASNRSLPLLGNSVRSTIG